MLTSRTSVDASDNVATRYLANDVCVLLRKPLVSASALRWEGQLSVYYRGKGPCYRCVCPEPPPQESVGRCSDEGVIGVVAGTMGCLAALEAIKLGSGKGEPLVGRMMVFDGSAGRCASVCLPVCSRCSQVPHHATPDCKSLVPCVRPHRGPATSCRHRYEVWAGARSTRSSGTIGASPLTCRDRRYQLAHAARSRISTSAQPVWRRACVTHTTRHSCSTSAHKFSSGSLASRLRPLCVRCLISVYLVDHVERHRRSTE